MDVCSHKELYDAVIAVGVAAHAITLFVDYWMSKAQHIESNNILELVLKGLTFIFKRKGGEKDGGQK